MGEWVNGKCKRRSHSDCEFERKECREGFWGYGEGGKSQSWRIQQSGVNPLRLPGKRRDRQISAMHTAP